MEIYRLPADCRTYLIEQEITTATPIQQKELEGKEALIKFYEDCYREVVIKDLNKWTGKPDPRHFHGTSTDELLTLRSSAYPHPTPYRGCYSRSTTNSNSLPTMPISRCPALELDTKFVRKVDMTWSTELGSFICHELSKLTANDPSKEDIKRAYHESLVNKCFEDVKKFHSSIIREEMEQRPLTKRDNYVARAAYCKLAGNLSNEVRAKFALAMDSSKIMDINEIIPYYEQHLIEAYQFIGVPERLAEKMIEDAKPPVTPIPEFVITTKYRAVPITADTPPTISNPTPHCDQWMARVDKQWMEKMLSQGWNVNLTAVSVSGKFGPTMNV